MDGSAHRMRNVAHMSALVVDESDELGVHCSMRLDLESMLGFASRIQWAFASH